MAFTKRSCTISIGDIQTGQYHDLIYQCSMLLMKVIINIWKLYFVRKFQYILSNVHFKAYITTI